MIQSSLLTIFYFYISEIDSTQRTLVRTNQVAPIIIKNCKEEYQHVTDFKDPIVYGRIADNMPEHALIQVSVNITQNIPWMKGKVHFYHAGRDDGTDYRSLGKY